MSGLDDGEWGIWSNIKGGGILPKQVAGFLLKVNPAGVDTGGHAWGRIEKRARRTPTKLWLRRASPSPSSAAFALCPDPSCGHLCGHGDSSDSADWKTNFTRLQILWLFSVIFTDVFRPACLKSDLSTVSLSPLSPLFLWSFMPKIWTSPWTAPFLHHTNASCQFVFLDCAQIPAFTSAISRLRHHEILYLLSLSAVLLTCNRPRHSLTFLSHSLIFSFLCWMLISSSMKP